MVKTVYVTQSGRTYDAETKIYLGRMVSASADTITVSFADDVITYRNVTVTGFWRKVLAQAVIAMDADLGRN